MYRILITYFAINFTSIQDKYNFGIKKYILYFLQMLVIQNNEVFLAVSHVSMEFQSSVLEIGSASIIRITT
jgi:hypothetical protein